MKPSIRTILPLAVLAGITATAGNDPPAPPQLLKIVQGLQGTLHADWEGVGGRTYFMQFSFDPDSWHYAPFMEFGPGEHSRGLSSDAGTMLLRLRYVDFPQYSSLEEAMGEDLDNDGLTNIFEVTHGYDPFEKESTMDGPDALLDPDGDGLSNASEQAAGTDPMVMDNPAVQLEVTVE